MRRYITVSPLLAIGFSHLLAISTG
ncbi:hypothetical protein FRAHR75_1500010 [Frankia sp. Hr75.2]|nr:hypothetical protein FRAHR75_1500010 [Frankia sp. Hr75.2]